MTEETIDHYPSHSQKRPAFLVVLCVLTWIVSAFTLLMSPINYFFSSQAESSTFQSLMNEMMMEIARESPEAADMMEGVMMAATEMMTNSIENAGLIVFSAVLVALLSAFGAYRMFQLKKQGFWIYITAKGIGLITPIIFLGANILVFLGLAFSAFIGLIMVVLYAVNLKRMS